MKHTKVNKSRQISEVLYIKTQLDSLSYCDIRKIAVQMVRKGMKIDKVTNHNDLLWVMSMALYSQHAKNAHMNFLGYDISNLKQGAANVASSAKNATYNIATKVGSAAGNITAKASKGVGEAVGVVASNLKTGFQEGVSKLEGK